MSSLSSSPAWLALKSHREKFAGTRLTELFAGDPDRFENFSLRLGDVLLDFSKNLDTAETMKLLVALARERRLGQEIQRLFNGEKINTSENRPALHTALRDIVPVMVDGVDVMPEIQHTLDRMREFAGGVRAGAIAGPDGRAFTDVINIGIGGSYLGPALVTTALAPYSEDGPRVHYIANVDAGAVYRTLSGLDPKTTLAIIESKTFTTTETLTNAKLVRDWLGLKAGAAGGNQLVAVTANTRLAADFGIAPSHVFPCWDWVGGRYSLWSAMGLPIALAVGMDNFEKLLRGAREMDAHFRD